MKISSKSCLANAASASVLAFGLIAAPVTASADIIYNLVGVTANFTGSTDTFTGSFTLDDTLSTETGISITVTGPDFPSTYTHPNFSIVSPTGISNIESTTPSFPNSIIMSIVFSPNLSLLTIIRGLGYTFLG